MIKFSKTKISEQIEYANDNENLPNDVRRLIYSFLPFEAFNKALKLSKSEREVVFNEKPYRTLKFGNRRWSQPNLTKDIPEKELI